MYGFTGNYTVVSPTSLELEILPYKQKKPVKVVYNITEKSLQSWLYHNVLIQDAFPFLTPDQREFMKTGMTQEDWDSMFKEDTL